LRKQLKGGKIYFGSVSERSFCGCFTSGTFAKPHGVGTCWGGRFFTSQRIERRARGRDQGLGITFKVTPPVTYFLQVGPTS
jgi:hypothetical protein